MKPLHRRSSALLATFATLAFAVPVFADAEDKLDHSFKVAAGGRLVLDADRGAIEVKTSPTVTEIRIEVRRKVTNATAEKGAEMLRDHEVTFAQEGSELRVTGRLTKQPGTFRFGRTPNLQVTWLVTAPAKLNVDVKTGGGGITVDDLEGEARVKSSGGSLRLGRVDGPVTASTGGGSISVAKVTQTAELRTSGGNIDVGSAAAGLTASTAGGSIKVSQAAAKTVLNTSGGRIEVTAAAGPVEANTSGGNIEATLTSQPAGECKFSTAGGSIKVALPASLAADLDAKTAGGSVSSALPVTVEGRQKLGVLLGKINGGGPLIHIRSGGGGITIEKAPASQAVAVPPAKN